MVVRVKIINSECHAISCHHGKTNTTQQIYDNIFTKTNNTLIVYVIYKSLTIKDTMLLLRHK